MQICFNCKHELTELDIQRYNAELYLNGLSPDGECNICSTCHSAMTAHNNFIDSCEDITQ